MADGGRASGGRVGDEDAAFAARFVFEAEGVVIGSFMEVSGLSAAVVVEEYTEGGNNRYAYKLPGRLSWPNLVLRRGVTSSNALFGWFATALQTGQTSARDGGSAGGGEPSLGMLQRRSATVSLRTPTGDVVRNWTVLEAFPVTWTGPRLATNATEVAVEELEIAHHGFAPEF